MNQAEQSLARILSGQYTPDPAAVGFTFEDGSQLVKNPELADKGEWIAFRKWTQAEVDAVNTQLRAKEAH